MVIWNRRVKTAACERFARCGPLPGALPIPMRDPEWRPAGSPRDREIVVCRPGPCCAPAGEAAADGQT